MAPYDDRDGVGVNPFHRPISHCWEILTNIEWKLPYLPQLLQTLVVVIIILVLLFLYLTIGVIAQITSGIASLIRDAAQQIQSTKRMEEKAAYGIAIGIYVLILLPFWVIQGPFWLIGKIANQIRERLNS